VGTGVDGLHMKGVLQSKLFLTSRTS
jgi:hypothetical protein